jgi:hypothetical protein
MLDNFMRDITMVMENINITMGAIMRVNGYMVRKKAKDFYLLLPALIMVNGLIM